jgi:hypothetical protein
MFNLIKNLFIYYLISSSFKVLISTTTSSSPENEIVISGIDNNKLEEMVEFFLDGSNKSLIHETKIITIDKLNSST